MKRSEYKIEIGEINRDEKKINILREMRAFRSILI